MIVIRFLFSLSAHPFTLPPSFGLPISSITTLSKRNIMGATNIILNILVTTFEKLQETDKVTLIIYFL